LNLFTALLLFYLLYVLIVEKSTELSLTLEFTKGAVFIFLLVLGLGTLNWYLETVKWQELMRQVHRIDRKTAVKSILLGISSNLILPNRTGDLAGRLRYIPKEKVWEALYINFFAACSQLLLTFLMGLIAIFFLSDQLHILLTQHQFLVALFIGAAILLSVFLYLRSNMLSRLFMWFKGKEKVEGLPSFDLIQRIRTLILSAARYFVFLIQFYLILTALGLNISLLESSYSLAVVFFINSFLPSNMLLELASKSAVVYLVFDVLSMDPMLGVSAMVLLWLINIAIPSALGIVLLKDIKWISPKNVQNQKI